MLYIKKEKVAIELLNSTLGLDDIPLELQGRIATALVLLDSQDGEDPWRALKDAYTYMGKDIQEIEKIIKEQQ